MSDSPYVFNVNTDNFTQYVIENSFKAPVLVDFWADWCAPCKSLMPVLAKLADEYQGGFLLAKVNSDEQRELSERYAIRSLPTVKVFKQGDIVDEFMGAQPEGVIRELIERHRTRPSDALRDQALRSAQQGDTAQAITLLTQAVSADPDNQKLKLDLAGLYASDGKGAAALALLDALPSDLREHEKVKALIAQLRYAQAAQDAPAPDLLLKQIAQEPDNLVARRQLAALSIGTGDFETALDQFMEIMRRDRSFEEDAGRTGMLAVFDMLGGSAELVSRYRRKMANLLL